MSMDRFYRYGYGRYLFSPDHLGLPKQFREVTRCLVRKDHDCGKFLGASKSCFVACPSTDEVETMLALITEKLEKIGIEPVIAIKERAYGQDIFCTKICGKIIESQFCLVILDDDIKTISSSKPLNVPNPNVYYEYGIMTALDKYVIPLQKDGQELAFNIQTHDTIKYLPRTLSAELDKAFKDAIKVTQEERSKYQDTDAISERFLIRCMEINGYIRKGSNWFLSNQVEDTLFTAFGHAEREEYLFFAFLNDKDALRNAITDMQVIVKRFEAKHKELSENINISSQQADKISQDVEEMEKEPTATTIVIASEMGTMSPRSHIALMHRELERVEKDRNENISKLRLMENSKFVIVFDTKLSQLKEKVMVEHTALDNKALNIPLYMGDTNSITIGDIEIAFKGPLL